MEIHPGIQSIELGLYIIREQVLVLADAHIGYEAELHAQGVLVPRLQFKDILDRLDRMFATLKRKGKRVRTIVLNGDLKHSFGGISRQEWADVLRFIDYLNTHAPIVIVKGNHDVILGPVLKKKNIILKQSYKAGDVLIIHGDKTPTAGQLKQVRTIIIGHEHPAIVLRDKAKMEKYKCFLKGRYARRTLLVQPSLQPLIEGTDVLQERAFSPLVRASTLEVYVLDEQTHETLYFGKLSQLR